jgi:hypothetical protein
MSGTLVSPGVQVQLVNESFYSSSGTGTTPLIVMATAANKLTPGSTSTSQTIAPGTTTTNQGSLYLITSQRELLQTFGNPTFYTQAGTPQNGNELNEYGLYTAYQYLGLANTAWVVNAPIDLGSLTPSATPPTGSPLNGDYWLDLSNTNFGLFRSSGNINSTLAWGAVKPMVLSTPSQLEVQVQGKKSSPILDLNAALITVTGPLAIVGVDVSLTSGMSLNQVVNAINTTTSLTNKGVRAEIFERMEIVAGTTQTVYNLRIVCSNIDTAINFARTPSPVNPTILTELGFVTGTYLADPTNPNNFIVPAASIGIAGDIAVNAVPFYNPQDVVSDYCIQIFEKLAVTTTDGTFTKWYLIGSVDSLADTGGPGNEKYGIVPGWSWASATPTVVTGATSSPTFTVNDEALITIGNTTATFTVASTSVAGTANDLNTFFVANSMNALATVVTQGIKKFLTITNYDGTNIGIVDQINSPFANAGFMVGQTFYSSVTGTIANPTFTTGDAFTIKTGSTTGTIVVGTGTLSDLITTINANTTLAKLITASQTTVGSNNYLTISSNNKTYFTITNVTGFNPSNPTISSAGIPTGVKFGAKLVYQGYSLSNPQPSTVDQVAAGNIWINTQSAYAGALFNVKRYNAGTQTWVTQNAPFYANDIYANSGFGSSIAVGSVYVKYDAFNDYSTNPPVWPTTATLNIRYWTGSGWQDIIGGVLSSPNNMFTQSLTMPTNSPADGTLWYSTNLQVDIMVNQFVNTNSENATAWVGYREAFPLTDANGVILSGTQPSYQSNGTSPLVDNDLWIDTSDLENYPKLYRYDGLAETWNLVDTTDHSSSSGIVFGDARQDTGSTSVPAFSAYGPDLLLSSYIDSDAPSSIAHPVGMLLFNTRYSTYNVKQWKPKYLPVNNTTNTTSGRWVTASGLMENGSPYMGRKAQRIMVVNAMSSVLVTNQDIRSENNYYNLIATPGYPELLADMITLNSDIKNIATVVVDTPVRLTPDGTSIQNWATNEANSPTDGEQGLTSSSPFAAVYYPWGLAQNVDGTNIVVPPSTALLRTIAFNDQVAYPWFAPAGFTRGLVSVFSSVGYLDANDNYVPVSLSQGQRDVMQINKINPIAYIQGRGLVVYGQLTLDPDSTAMNRVNVARLVNYLNYNLENLAKPFLFEPNDQFTRDSVTRTFTTFMADLISLRGLYDYAVLCDDSNNTPNRIDANQLWIDIAIKPTKAIEFIYIPLRILNTGDPLPSSQ